MRVAVMVGETREERLRRQLRENLRRRKGQARAQRAADEGRADEPDPETAGDVSGRPTDD